MIGAAAPARAWCEAACLVPAEIQSHCQTHGPVDGTTSLSASLVDDCPVAESARPAPARLDVQVSLSAIDLPAPVARTWRPASLERLPSATTVFERCTPLRI
jgi:hypothetical protein